MIYAVRSADVKHGKLEETFEWAVRVAAHVNEKQGTNLQVLRNVGGAGQRVHWVATYDSLAAYEEIGAKIVADEGYQALVAELRDKELLGDWEDNLFATVP